MMTGVQVTVGLGFGMYIVYLLLYLKDSVSFIIMKHHASAVYLSCDRSQNQLKSRAEQENLVGQKINSDDKGPVGLVNLLTTIDIYV